MFQIELQNMIYKLEIYHAQINITSRCNMRCEHCRGSYDGGVDLSVDDFERLLIFSQRHLCEGGGFLISGGEPLLHPKFKQIMALLRQRIQRKNFVALTTNGYFLEKNRLEFLRSLNFPDLRIAISLDSVDQKRHNAFRHCVKAHENSLRAIGLAAKMPRVKCIVRATIQQDQIEEVGMLAELVEFLGADTLSVSSILPVGRALNKPGLYFNKASKKRLIEYVIRLRSKHPHLMIDVNDPLAYIFSSCVGETGEFGGCIAGIGSFSVEPDGSMLPCPVLPNQVIMNIHGLTPRQIMTKYRNSSYVHKLLERSLKGKCKSCSLRFTCGGCRARAEGIFGDYLEEDPDCWL